ncbi:MAG: hypothetical protein ACI4VF_04305 [Lachnospirales bacterium]
MRNKVDIIEDAINAIYDENDNLALNIINKEYPFKRFIVHKRKYTIGQKLNIFIRDGFIDRYSGDRLINPGVLKILSLKFPIDFPYQPHGKMDECHIAYWELMPSIDHVEPIAFGGTDNDNNLVTTSMMHNMIKNNWTLEQLNWSLYSCGNIRKWDGLTKIFLKYVDKDKKLLEDNYINNWYKISKKYIDRLY